MSKDSKKLLGQPLLDRTSTTSAPAVNMVDRLGDLGMDRASGGSEDLEDGISLRPKGGAGELEPKEGFMTGFFQEVGHIKAKMAVIRRNIKLIEQKHQAALTAITMDLGKQMSQEVDELTDHTNQLSQDIRKQLKQMEERNKAEPAEKNSSEDRIRKNMQGTLSRKFMELMTEYQDVQNKYKDKYRERVARQLKIVNPTASQDEIDETLRSGQPVFATPVLSTGQAAAMNALADIQEKHADILKLEKSLEELHQLFVDMAILVETQGELLNQIEYSVEQSSAYIEKGIVELTKAKEYQKSARKKMCIIICCLVVIMAVIVFGALGGLGKL